MGLCPMPSFLQILPARPAMASVEGACDGPRRWWA
jgi:hypothetical protein